MGILQSKNVNSPFITRTTQELRIPAEVNAATKEESFSLSQVASNSLKKKKQSILYVDKFCTSENTYIITSSTIPSETILSL